MKPFGSWKSPIASSSLVENSLRLGNIQVDDGNVIWTEGRPSEKGRTALMSWTRGSVSQELSSPTDNLRTRAHEYGGKSFTAANGRIFFLQFGDQQIYELLPGGESVQITSNPDFRYADIRLDENLNQLITVGEDHSDPDDVLNMLLSISLDGNGEQAVIASGHDFYANPELSPDGSHLSFLTWDHPNMPWDGTELWLADIEESGELSGLRKIAGGKDESVFQPQWDPSGDLHFISDRSGWWNLYSYADGKVTDTLAMDAEFGLPQWVFGMSTYAVLSEKQLIASYRDNEGSYLVRINVNDRSVDRIELPYTDMDQIRAEGELVAFIGSGPDTPAELVVLDLGNRSIDRIQASASISFDKNYISIPESILFEVRPGEPVQAWYYPPNNPEYEGPVGEAPPLIVLSHGGPTAYSPGVFSMVKQYWTTRGFAVVDVNYSGSTGFGRPYRQRLNRNWGIRDIEDCSAAANYLVETGKADPERLVIKGGSAGGFTTLAALAFGDVFKAGASYYGVGDLELLAKDTHKFESRYLDSLIGAYPEEQELYIARSPLNFSNQIECPVIFMQGLDDPVVPPNQAETMVNALKQKGLPVAYLPFEGESHGFRQASTITKAAESELYFYSKVFGFELAEDVEPVEIFNL